MRTSIPKLQNITRFLIHCSGALSEKGENKNEVKLTVTYDMVWQKRSSGRIYDSSSGHHRWELPVLRYHRIRVNYPYPFVGVKCWVIFMILLDKITIKESNRYPFFLIMVNYPIFSLNDHILYFQMYFQYFSFLSKHLNNVSKNG